MSPTQRHPFGLIFDHVFIVLVGAFFLNASTGHINNNYPAFPHLTYTDSFWTLVILSTATSVIHAAISLGKWNERNGWGS